MSFVAHLKSLSSDESAVLCASYHTYKDAEEKWLAANPKLKNMVMKLSAKRRSTDSLVRYRLATGRAFLDWQNNEGKESKRKLADFMHSIQKFEGKVPKKTKVWLAACAKLASSKDDRPGVLLTGRRNLSMACLLYTSPSPRD